MTSERKPSLIKHIQPDHTEEIPWGLFLSSDRRMTRNLTREIVHRRSLQTPMLPDPSDATWSQYFKSKGSDFVELCRHYPITTFLGSNRQMVRRVTSQASSSRRKWKIVPNNCDFILIIDTLRTTKILKSGENCLSQETVTLLWHMVLVSLVRHHTSHSVEASPLF